MKMTLEQHKQFGEDIKRFKELLLLPHILLVENTKTSRPRKAVWKALKAINQLKDEMDNLVCRDFPSAENVTQIYYGCSQQRMTEREKICSHEQTHEATANPHP